MKLPPPFAALLLCGLTAPNAERQAPVDTSAPQRLPWPVTPLVVYQVYGSPSTPKQGGLHKGVDLAAPNYTTVYAAEAGTVVLLEFARSSERRNYKIHAAECAIQSASHPERTIRYRHLDPNSIRYKLGDSVKSDALIGEISPWGNDKHEPHVHIEVAKLEVTIDVVNGSRLPNLLWSEYLDPELLFEPIEDKSPPTIGSEGTSGFWLDLADGTVVPVTEDPPTEVFDARELRVEVIDAVNEGGHMIPPRYLEVRMVRDGGPPVTLSRDLSALSAKEIVQMYGTSDHRPNPFSMRCSELLPANKQSAASSHWQDELLIPGSYHVQVAARDRSGNVVEGEIRFKVRAKP